MTTADLLHSFTGPRPSTLERIRLAAIELYLETGKYQTAAELAARLGLSKSRVQNVIANEGRGSIGNGIGSIPNRDYGSNWVYGPTAYYLREAIVVGAMCEGLRALNDPFQGYEGFGDPASRLVHLLERTGR